VGGKQQDGHRVVFRNKVRGVHFICGARNDWENVRPHYSYLYTERISTKCGIGDLQ
jgi:hypothetical protein